MYGIKPRSFFSGYFAIPDVTPQSGILGFTGTSMEHLVTGKSQSINVVYINLKDSQNLGF